MSLPIKLFYTDAAVLLREAESEMDCISNEIFFNSPKQEYQKLREKWCAAMFGIGYGKYISECKVAVNDTDQRVDSDFFVLVGENEHPFQLVEAPNPDRKRGKEYKQLANGTRESVPYRPEKGRVEGPQWIIARVKKKAAKCYATANRLNLLVYANFEANPMDYQTLKEMVRDFSGTFASIWVITNSKICTLCGSTDLGEINGWQSVRSPF
jgi:hypothetical protein